MPLAAMVYAEMGQALVLIGKEDLGIGWEYLTRGIEGMMNEILHCLRNRGNLLLVLMEA